MASPADEMLEQMKRQTELLEKLVPKNEGKAGGGGNALNTIAGIMSNLGGGRIAQAGTQLSSLTNNIQKLGVKGGDGKVGAGLAALGAGKQLAGNALGAVGGAMKSLAGVAGLAGTALGPMGAMLGGMTHQLTAPIDAIKGLVDSISGFVSLANPGVVQQFTYAMTDLMAVVGGMLTPVMQGLTVYTRAIGDSFAKLTPVLQPLFDAFGQFFADYAVMAANVIEAWAPFIQLLTDTMIPVINALGKGMAVWNGILVEILNTISEFFGLSSRFDPDKTGKGAAVRATAVNSVEGFANAAFAKSIQGIFAGGQGKNPEQQRDEIKKAILEGKQIVQDIKAAVEKVAEWVKNPQVIVTNAVKDAAKGAAQAGVDLALPGVWQLAKLAFD
jgi:hypothetical protein